MNPIMKKEKTRTQNPFHNRSLSVLETQCQIRLRRLQQPLLLLKLQNPLHLHNNYEQNKFFFLPNKKRKENFRFFFFFFSLRHRNPKREKNFLLWLPGRSGRCEGECRSPTLRAACAIDLRRTCAASRGTEAGSAGCAPSEPTG